VKLKWVTIEENNNYSINQKGEIRYNPKNTLKKVKGNNVLLYKNDQGTSYNIINLLNRYFPDREHIDNEIWKPVVDYKGLYEVSNLGRLKCLPILISNKICNYKRATRVLKGSENAYGYLVSTLTGPAGPKVFLHHRLVAFAFLQKIKGKDAVNHKDGNKKNNRADNLEWCTDLENSQHAWNNGLAVVGKRSKGKDHHNSRPVKQMDLKGNVVNVFSSITEAAEHVNGKNPNLHRALNKENAIAYGYRWNY
jgi:hypothetical protein